MSQSDERRELLELADAYCADRLTDEQARRLGALLRGESERQRLFLAYVEVHAGLCWGLRGGGAGRPARRRAAGRRWLVGVGGVAAFAAGLLLALWLGGAGSVPKPSPSNPLHPPASVATLRQSEQALWIGEAPDLPTGARLPSGPIELVAGLAEVELDGGAVVVLEAPVRVELRTGSDIVLRSGRLVSRAPTRAAGLSVEAAQARILDHDAELGVAADPSGPLLIQVYQGRARARLPNVEPVEVRAGESFRIDELEPQPVPVPFEERRFVRRLEPRPTGRQLPLNRPAIDEVRVVPAPPGVRLDGDLSDWNRAGLFSARATPPWDHDYQIVGMMMHDAAGLYLGAHVRDPFPMRNVLDPETDANIAWRGGSVQVRLAVVRQQPWPLDAYRPRLRTLLRQLPGPWDDDPRIVHLNMWHFAPLAQACLYVERGMDFQSADVNPPGYRGAFQRDADGRGYTLEYFLPWPLLAAGEDPPQAGDQLACCWVVHWSDAAGRNWQGHLIEVCNPLEFDNVATFRQHGSTFLRADLWGRAVFLPRWRSGIP
ncbi:MAG: hypothetical protein NZ700_16905 [Gemmataceae bacterium]|nr:hypothetical protein [Gemmataceae bacterium]MDW8265384.1 hypothetical protein [Gemmataceae bacterium]